MEHSSMPAVVDGRPADSCFSVEAAKTPGIFTESMLEQ
jgi:hypothetical protein